MTTEASVSTTPQPNGRKIAPRLRMVNRSQKHLRWVPESESTVVLQTRRLAADDSSAVEINCEEPYPDERFDAIARISVFNLTAGVGRRKDGGWLASK